MFKTLTLEGMNIIPKIQTTGSLEVNPIELNQYRSRQRIAWFFHLVRVPFQAQIIVPILLKLGFSKL